MNKKTNQISHLNMSVFGSQSLVRTHNLKLLILESFSARTFNIYIAPLNLAQGK